jgi:prostaglandin-E synthase
MFIIKKQEKGPYWPRLLKDGKKVHWLKADWNKWKDEDDEEEVDEMAGGGGGGQDFDSMFKQMGKPSPTRNDV